MLKLLIVLVVSALSFSAYCADRVVILAPAAADILQKLNVSDKIVGVTKNVKEFPDATVVGTHLKPNVEIIKSLKPDLLIVGNGKYFTDEIKDSIGVRTITYDPTNLAEILLGIRTLGKEFGKANIAGALEKSLKTEMRGLKKPTCKVSVFYEVTQEPLMAAGTDSIVSDIITRAGGSIVSGADRKLYKTSPEAVIMAKPDIYIYQTGAMNKNPVQPQDRPEYKNLKAQYLRVNESDYSRANSQAFENVKYLNNIFNRFCLKN